MARKVQLINPQVKPSPSRHVQPTDWTKCILCQAMFTEYLQCPAASTCSDKGAGYHTLSANIWRFVELKELPIPIDIRRVDDGPGMAATLQQQAKCHKSCHSKLNTTKLQRADKRISASHEEPSTTSKKYTGQSNQTNGAKTNVCFFCEEISDSLHEASTFSLDSRVRKWALDLQDNDSLPS